MKTTAEVDNFIKLWTPLFNSYNVVEANYHTLWNQVLTWYTYIKSRIK